MPLTHPSGMSMPQSLKGPPSIIAPSTQNSTKASNTSRILTKEEEEALQQQDNISLQAQFEDATAASVYPSTHEWTGRCKYSPDPSLHSTSTALK